MEKVIAWCEVCKRKTESDKDKVMYEHHHWCKECGKICLVCGMKWPEQLPKRVIVGLLRKA